jgi:hypothetical protein
MIFKMCSEVWQAVVDSTALDISACGALLGCYACEEQCTSRTELWSFTFHDASCILIVKFDVCPQVHQNVGATSKL